MFVSCFFAVAAAAVLSVSLIPSLPTLSIGTRGALVPSLARPAAAAV